MGGSYRVSARGDMFARVVGESRRRVLGASHCHRPVIIDRTSKGERRKRGKDFNWPVKGIQDDGNDRLEYE